MSVIISTWESSYHQVSAESFIKLLTDLIANVRCKLNIEKKGFKRVHGHACKVSCLFSTRVSHLHSKLNERDISLSLTKQKQKIFLCDVEPETRRTNLRICSYNHIIIKVLVFFLFTFLPSSLTLVTFTLLMFCFYLYSSSGIITKSQVFVFISKFAFVGNGTWQ